MLERRGVISGYEGSKPRQVLITGQDLPRMLAALAEKGDIAAPAGSGTAANGDVPDLPDAAALSSSEDPLDAGDDQPVQ